MCIFISVLWDFTNEIKNEWGKVMGPKSTLRNERQNQDLIPGFSHSKACVLNPCFMDKKLMDPWWEGHRYSMLSVVLGLVLKRFVFLICCVCVFYLLFFINYWCQGFPIQSSDSQLGGQAEDKESGQNWVGEDREYNFRKAYLILWLRF